MERDYIAETSNGKVRGYGRKGVIKFKGIPYAGPPDGANRFKPPVPVEPWTGVRDALEYSPIAPQNESQLEAMFGNQRKQDEADCLTLNIWTSSVDGNKRPVMFFIHGGGFVTGTGAGLDGARLVLRGDVVVVAINYRLGVLGFLHMPDIADATSNAGLLDMVAALKFVRENIANFGGDPDNVTIFGESAGGFAVSSLLAMPAAKGLFKRAIPQSGAAHPLGFNAEAAVRTYEDFIEVLGIKKGDIDALRKLSAEEMMKAQEAITPARAGASFSRPLRLGPVVEKDVLPEHPLDALGKGFAGGVDVFIGSNLDETKLWNLWNPEADNISEEEVLEGVKEMLSLIGKDGAGARKLIDIYRQIRKTPRNIMDAINTDYRFRIPSIRLAEAQSAHQKNTYMYLFTWPSPMKGGKYGAMHALELAFVFGVLLPQDVGIFPQRTEETEALSKTIMDTWIAFARNGNPNNPGIPALAPYEPEKRATVIFNKKIEIIDDPYGRERAGWEGLL